MKKLLLSSIILLFFTISITLFQISCQKSASAQNSTGTLVQHNKLIFKRIFTTASGGVFSEIWTSKYDGSLAFKVNIILPQGVKFSGDLNPVMSPDGTKMFFTAGPSAIASGEGDLYSCNADGSNVLKIVDRGSGRSDNIILGDAY